jgi:hypothetical protein
LRYRGEFGLPDWRLSANLHRSYRNESMRAMAPRKHPRTLGSCPEMARIRRSVIASPAVRRLCRAPNDADVGDFPVLEVAEWCLSLHRVLGLVLENHTPRSLPHHSLAYGGQRVRFCSDTATSSQRSKQIPNGAVHSYRSRTHNILHKPGKAPGRIQDNRRGPVTLLAALSSPVGQQ